jgi:hypothetical protein
MEGIAASVQSILPSGSGVVTWGGSIVLCVDCSLLRVPFDPGFAARRLALVAHTFAGVGRLKSRNWAISSSVAGHGFCVRRVSRD